ncbi:MAG: polyprenol monophosphomannose synthase [Thermoleophilaceae bacterium]|nr:polyprenol monophosphomannose synthase [Thermoleophilaceae bacterium]
MPGPWLVIPTYNERPNIEALVVAVLPHMREAGGRVLVVDDSSPDGTGELADAVAAANPDVEVLHRAEKDGLGRAYLAGFHHALAGGADLVLEMDADFSHDPADVPRLLAASQSADLVLGSRYVEGGGVREWGLFRRMLSRGGSLYARTVLGVDIRDLTGGFKCFHRRVLEEIHLERIQADGYGFQIETTYRAIKAEFRVEEIPIVFTERLRGESKMNARIAIEAAWKVPDLRRRGRSVK